MPRRPRIYIPDQPQHVVARGHNRQPIFKKTEDFRYFYRCLKSSTKKYALSIHAWVFMSNHIHLLVTPADRDSLSKTMQSIGRRYGHYFNKAYQRRGALWEDRYKSAVVDTENYLLSCYRYIELNPVRAGMVHNPEAYPYSSYHANAMMKPDPLTSAHPVFSDFIRKAGLRENKVSGHVVYQQLCREIMDEDTLFRIRQGTEKGVGIGRSDFLLKIRRQTKHPGSESREFSSKVKR